MRTRTIRQRIHFASVSPEDIYTALLSSKQHSDFTGANARCSAKVGRRFDAWNKYISGRNVELAKDKKIVQEWKTVEWPPGYEPSILTLSLKKKGNGTELNMTQTKVPASQYHEYDKGWYESYWEPMKEYFRNRVSTRPDDRNRKTKR